jgi:hypothetical protein
MSFLSPLGSNYPICRYHTGRGAVKTKTTTIIPESHIFEGGTKGGGHLKINNA